MLAILCSSQCKRVFAGTTQGVAYRIIKKDTRPLHRVLQWLTLPGQRKPATPVSLFLFRKFQFEIHRSIRWAPSMNLFRWTDGSLFRSFSQSLAQSITIFMYRKALLLAASFAEAQSLIWPKIELHVFIFTNLSSQIHLNFERETMPFKEQVR